MPSRKFSDDRQVTDEELGVIRRIAVRLRDCPHAGQIANLPGSRQLGGRGRMFEIEGLLGAVERVQDPSGEPLWRCAVSDGGQAVIYLADVPEKLRTHGTGQRVAAEGVFVKYLPSAEPIAVLVAPRLRAPCTHGRRSDSPLGKLGMDCALFEGIRDDTAMTAADHEAFYRLLILARNADPADLRREAERLDPASQGLPALFPGTMYPWSPAAERGRLVTLSGIARRVVRVPIDERAVVSRLGADHYFEIDLAADDSRSNPLVFCTLDLPEGMAPFGPVSDGERVEVTGFFLKNWQYPTALSEEEKAANPGSSLALQTAPLVIGPAPLGKQPVPPGQGTKIRPTRPSAASSY